MKLVDLALNHWSLGTAQVTTAANTLIRGSRLLPQISRWGTGLRNSSLCINSRGHDQSAQRELAGSNLQQIRIGMFAQGDSQEAESNEHQDRTRRHDPVGCLRRHDSYP
jgi:hypothetical protein